VAWQSDGSATVNGETCSAYCITGTGENYRVGRCASLGVPPAQGGCQIVLDCCEGFPGEDSGLSPCGGTNPDTIAGVTFVAVSGQDPTAIHAVPAYADTFMG
jgi:hypothetical protein